MFEVYKTMLFYENLRLFPPLKKYTVNEKKKQNIGFLEFTITFYPEKNVPFSVP